MGQLREAIEGWIKADWWFRHGPQAYTRSAQTGLFEAEDELRRVAAGTTESVEAARRLGCKTNWNEGKRRKRILPIKSKSVEGLKGERVKMKLPRQEGLFDQ